MVSKKNTCPSCSQMCNEGLVFSGKPFKGLVLPLPTLTRAADLRLISFLAVFLFGDNAFHTLTAIEKLNFKTSDLEYDEKFGFPSPP